MCCDCECCGEDGGKKRHCGGALGVRRSSRTLVLVGREFIGDYLLKATMELFGRADASPFVVVTHDSEYFEQENDPGQSFVEEIIAHNELFAVMAVDKGGREIMMG